jgi:1,2-diacylglycerol 3-alpha-glucosyltransferase
MKVFIVCSGLGNTQRGYETFFASLFDVFKDEPNLELTLFKGGGARSKAEHPLWNLPSESSLAKKIGNWLGVGCPTLGRGYYVEQATFFISLIPRLVLGRPDVVYFSDFNLGQFIWHWKRLSRQRFKLLFRNGGAYPPPYPRFDHVQQITSVCFDAAIAAGESRESQTLLPSGFAIPKVLERRFTKRELRESLSLPLDRTVILTVSAVNKSQKRLDYLIEELAMLPHPRPFLAILGQRGHESIAVEELASAILGADHYFIRTVPQDVVDSYYQAADIFVLASLREGFGRVMVEALAAGLPCVVYHVEMQHISVATKVEYAQKVVSLLPWVPESGQATTRCSLAATGQQRQVAIPLFPLPDQLASVYSAQGEKANS